MKNLTINKWSIGLSAIALVVIGALILTTNNNNQNQANQMAAEHYAQVKAEVRAIAPNQQLSETQKQKINAVLNNESAQIPYEVLANLPLSLQGSPLPSALAVHDDGSLVIAIAVRQYFDYFLTAIGEEPLTLIAERVKYQLSQQLEQPALGTALDIFANYLAYRDELAQLLHAGEQDYANLRAQIKASRDSHFEGLVVEAFFAQEDSYDEYMHKRSALNSDESLSAAAKQAQAQELLANAPDWLQQQHKKANQLNDFYAAKADLKASGADDAQIQALREQSFGVEAADRLAALAKKRAQWQQKLADYHTEVSDLLAANLSPQMLNDELSLLRRQHFTDKEILRVQAIDSNKFDDLL